MPHYPDQLHRIVDLAERPKRIVSVVPSQTELLFDLDLVDEIVGVTKFCVHPKEKVRIVMKIGGTKQLDIAKITDLKPDLIIANKEENDQQQIEQLMELFPVWVSDIGDLNGAVEMIEIVGEMVGKTAEAKKLTDTIRQDFAGLLPLERKLRTAYFIWRNPYMVTGCNTFIDNMLSRCGFINAFDQPRYPEIDGTLLRQAKPELILLSSEPYPFKEKHIEELQAILPEAVIKLVDGEMFSWYGSRLLQAPGYFKQLLEVLSKSA
ncbi:MAG TPA: helical backbone metal receptor [Mucilaginibacter sp.]|nr:helical backbone metal receptor [Mucilaginibacter sp.]